MPQLLWLKIRRNVMKKSIRLLALLLAVVMVLTACGGTTAEAPAAAEAAGEAVAEADEGAVDGAVELNFVMKSENYTQQLQDSIARWEEKTGNKINVMMTEDPTTTVYTQIMAGGTLDLFRGEGTKYAEVQWPAEYFYDLSNEEWVSRLANPSQIAFSDGTIKGVPISCPTILGMIYRKDIFEAAGITEVPKTWDEFLAACEAIKTNTDAIPVQIAAESSNTWSGFHLCHSLFSGLYNSRGEDGAKKVFKAMDAGEQKLADIPEYVQALDQVCELRDKGYFNDDFISSTFESSTDRIGSGEAAMMACGDYIMEPLLASYPDVEDKLGFFSVPFGDTDGSMPLCTYPGIHVAYNAPHLEEALDFVAYFCSKENQEIFNEETPGYNLFSDVPTSGNFMHQYIAENGQKVFTEVDEAGIYYWAEEEGRRCLQELLAGTMTSKEMLERMDEEATITCQGLGMEGF